MGKHFNHIRGTLSERFWPKVNIPEDQTKCWLWLASKDLHGYGVCTRETGKTAWAHRLSYELSIGQIPAGKELDHLCRTPACVNPLHLEPVTHSENLKRSPTAGRYDRSNANIARGEMLPQAKLTKENVLEIRASDYSNEELADKFSVSSRSVYDARLSKTWKWLQ